MVGYLSAAADERLRVGFPLGLKVSEYLELFKTVVPRGAGKGAMHVPRGKPEQIKQEIKLPAFSLQAPRPCQQVSHLTAELALTSRPR